jgi:hypothetical protein
MSFLTVPCYKECGAHMRIHVQVPFQRLLRLGRQHGVNRVDCLVLGRTFYPTKIKRFRQMQAAR